MCFGAADKCMGTHIWPCRKKVKSQTRVIIWTNFVVYDAIYQDSALSFLDFYVFLSYMGMASISINGPWPFVQFFNSPLKEGSIWSVKKTCPGVSEEKSIKDVDGPTTDDEQATTVRRTTDGEWSQ